MALLVVLLGIYFRQWNGVVLPLSGDIVSAIWGLGFISIMGYQLEPLVLVIPMLITARAVSHSVQFVERFYEEYERLEDKEAAVISSMAELLLPGTLAIVTDAFGIFVIGVSSIALMKKVAMFGAFWALSIAITEMLLNRLLIMYFPAPKSTKHYTPPVVRAMLSRIAAIATGPRSAKVVVAVWLVVVLLSASVALRVKVGESRPGTPILWDDSEFNESARIISSKFFGADDFMVIVESERPGGIHRPAVLLELATIPRSLEQDPRVDSVLYPGLPSHPQYGLAQTQMNGFGGIVTFFIVREGVEYLAERPEPMEFKGSAGKSTSSEPAAGERRVSTGLMPDAMLHGVSP